MEYSVLIVESDSKNQSDLNEILKNNFNIEQIVTVDNEQSAHEELDNRDSIHCIFVSTGIIGNNGYDFVSRIKEHEKHKNTAILILSEDNSREALLQAAASGANELIATPISPKLLGLKLKRVFRSKVFRTKERISVMGALEAVIQFKSGAYYTTKLNDISAGGCSVKSPLLSEGGGVYDKVQIILENAGQSVEFPAELVRIEKDPESELSKEKQLILAFQMNDIDKQNLGDLNQFIESLGKAKAKT